MPAVSDQVVLQHDAAQSTGLRERRHLERVPLARVRVRAVVSVQVDGAGEDRIRELLVDGRRRRGVLVGFPVSVRRLPESVTR